MDQHLRELAAALPGKRVLVAGDVMLDEYVWGEVRRISPEAPVPVVAVRRRTSVPGGAANSALNVASLGGRVVLGGILGEDPAADRLAAALRQRGVAGDGLLVDRERVTTTKTRIIAQNQQVARVDEEQHAAPPGELEARLLRWVEDRLPAVDACLLSDYAKGVVTPRFAGHLIGLARRAGKPVVVDPKGTDYAKYRGATVVKPNLREAQLVCHHEPDRPARLPELGRQLLDILDGSAVLLTRGPEGMSLFVRGAEPVHIAPVARDVFDVTGAGDTVVATLALALAAGAPLEQAAALANRAAGIVVAKVGTAQVTLEELLASPDS